MTIDAKIVLFLNNIVQSSPIVSDATAFFASYFPWIIVFLLFFWLVFSFRSGKEKVSVLMLTLSSVLIARFGVTEMIRFFYHRPRPYVEHSDIHALFNINQWSFPSGHATIFFSIATTILFFNKKIGVSLYIAAIIISVCRVAAGVHFPTDIFAGMLIGIGTSYIIFYIFNKNKKVE